MSIRADEEVECIECGEKQATTVWRAINASLDPDAKQALLNGEINVFRCASCGTQALIEVDLLYHDLERGVGVQYFPPASIDEDRFLDNFNEQGEFAVHLANLNVPDHLRRPHVVFDLNEMVRYILFRDRLCERRAAPGRDGANAADEGEPEP